MNRKKLISAIGIGTTLLLSVVFVSAQQAMKSKGELKFIEGEAVDIYCHVVRNLEGDQMSACAERTEKRQLPVGIVDSATGELYLAAFRRRRPANVWPVSAMPELVPYLGKIVSAQGTVFEKSGMKFIEIHTLSEAIVDEDGEG